MRNSEIIQVDALAGNGVLISRQVFTQIGLYNEKFLPHYHADSEMTMRAHSRGIKVFVSPAIILL
ncbi:MAG: glycosyltransferase family 2 protein, partial [Pseudanabaena sp.]